MGTDERGLPLPGRKAENRISYPALTVLWGKWRLGPGLVDGRSSEKAISAVAPQLYIFKLFLRGRRLPFPAPPPPSREPPLRDLWLVDHHFQ